MDKKRIRNILRLFWSLVFCWLYIPHLILSLGNTFVKDDLIAIQHQIGFRLPIAIQLIYQLHNNRYYRTLFYHRLGPVKAVFIRWYIPGDRYFNISATTKIGSAMWIAHPYATVINAESIGDNFRCIHCTTIGEYNGRPTIGDNVSLGANVTIIGGIHIGNNVTIGAGSVVVKDLPDNCVAVGNPARVIKKLN